MNSIEVGEDFLAQSGVLGMHWGQTKDRSQTAPSGSATKVKQPTHRQQVNAAITKKYSKNSTAILDDRSAKTIHHGNVATATALGAVGSFGIAILSRDARVKAGASAVSIILSGVSLGNSAAENNSANNDLLKKYGK